MKKIIKPKQNEESIYFSDFTGKPLGEYDSVTLKIDCGYGSIYDGADVTLHLDDNDLSQLIKFLKTKVSEDFKNQVRSTKKKLEKDYDNNAQCRDWQSCDYLHNSIGLLKELV